MMIDPHATEPDFRTPLYDVTIILGKPVVTLFLSDEWMKLVGILDPIVQWSSYKGSITSSQMFEPIYKFVKGLKAIEWNEKNNRKLALQHLNEGNETSNLYSLFTNVVCPSWKSTDKLKVFPDLIIKIEKNLIPNDERFDFSFMLALRKELLNAERNEQLQTIISEVAHLMHSTLVVRKERPYRYRFISGGWTDLLQDVFPGSIVNEDPDLVNALKVKDWNVLNLK